MLTRAGTRVVVGPVIGGERLDSDDNRDVIVDAPDGAPLYELNLRPEPDVVAAAVAAASSARDLLRCNADERAVWLRGGAALLRGRAGHVADHVVRESGKPVAQALREVASAARTLEQAAGYAESIVGRVLTGHSQGVWGLELLEPAGIAVLVSSWNFPLQGPAIKVAAALAAGCPVVLKPSPLACLSALDLAWALHHSGCPPAAVGVVPGGAQTAVDLVRHPDVAMVSVTGSTAAGRALMHAAADPPRRCVMELGGKCAQILFDDADLDSAIPALVRGIVRNQGAACNSGNRILVHDSMYDRVRDRMVAELRSVRVGDPYEMSTEMGALRVAGKSAELLDIVRDAVDRGARVATGAATVPVPGRTGEYITPTLLEEVDRDDPVWREELFGPVAVLRRFSSEEEAVALAADSAYGLAVGLWSRDLGRLERVWSHLEVGTVYCNSYGRRDDIPLAASGRRCSGFGSEHGPAGVREFLAVKSVHVSRPERSA